jgi:hypothetical protein
MFNKIPQRNPSISHIIHLRSLKGRTRILPWLREKKENHLAFIARKMVMMMNIVGNYIQRRDQNNLVERGRLRPFLQCNKILVPVQEIKERSQ